MPKRKADEVEKGSGMFDKAAEAAKKQRRKRQKELDRIMGTFRRSNDVR
jgi:hypothetical protein